MKYIFPTSNVTRDEIKTNQTNCCCEIVNQSKFSHYLCQDLFKNMTNLSYFILSSFLWPKRAWVDIISLITNIRNYTCRNQCNSNSINERLSTLFCHFRSKFRCALHFDFNCFCRCCCFITHFCFEGVAEKTTLEPWQLIEEKNVLIRITLKHFLQSMVYSSRPHLHAKWRGSSYFVFRVSCLNPIIYLPFSGIA